MTSADEIAASLSRLQSLKGLYRIVQIRTCCPSAPHDKNMPFKCCHGNIIQKTMGKYYSIMWSSSCSKVRVIFLFLRGLFNAFPVQGQLVALIRWRNFNSCRNMCFTTKVPSQADPQIPLCDAVILAAPGWMLISGHLSLPNRVTGVFR